MAAPEPAEVTKLLRAWGNGDKAALDRLTAVVYDELRRIARRYMRDERAGLTLQTTALVNEALRSWADAGDRSASGSIPYRTTSGFRESSPWSPPPGRPKV